jgi:hypothetical protein
MRCAKRAENGRFRNHRAVETKQQHLKVFSGRRNLRMETPVKRRLLFVLATIVFSFAVAQTPSAPNAMPPVCPPEWCPQAS